ncbi:MAG: flagellar hook protein FlgE [Sulfuricella sp.]|nr:flagellar hook protein FlgE [Sulfuricella sp.]
MSLQQGLSGLDAASKYLDVVGNNVANSGTAGFKAAQAQFGDVFAASLAGSGVAPVGIGTQLSAVAQQFTQGNITVTNNPLDIAINGTGFFGVAPAGSSSPNFTRNGQFHLDKDGYIVTSAGNQLQGLAYDTAGNLSTVTAGLQINTQDMSATPTTAMGLTMNLNANAAVPTGTWTDPDPNAVAPTPTSPDPTSYNNSTSLSIYDSQGISHTATLYFVKTAANSWDVHLSIDGYGTDGVALSPVGGAATASPLTTLVFDAAGKPTSGTTPSVQINLAAIDPQLGGSFGPIKLDLSNATQYGGPFGVTAATQNGNMSGSLASYAIDGKGVILGHYSNGMNRPLGQIQLYSFSNPQGLVSLGGNQWGLTSASGQALVNLPGTAGMGVLQSSATEDSNVDMTAELVKMITAQRIYQANAQSIKTQDAMLQTLVNLR